MPVLSRSLACVLACLLAAGCSASSAPSSPPAPDLHASITQFRNDEGTRNLRAGVTNVGHTTVTVTRATIDWPGFEKTSLHIEPWTLHHGETAGFTMQYGDARCDHEPDARPMLDVEVDGTERRYPLKVEDPQLFDRLYRAECAGRRLADTSSVTLELAGSTIQQDGEEYLNGDVVLRRRPGSRDPVTVVDLGGSVLLHLVPRQGDDALPVRLKPGRKTVRLPVLVGSAHRCDPHALGNSSQTFLLSVYLRLGRDPVQRVITVPDRHHKALLTGVIRRDCR